MTTTIKTRALIVYAWHEVPVHIIPCNFTAISRTLKRLHLGVTDKGNNSPRIISREIKYMKNYFWNKELDKRNAIPLFNYRGERQGVLCFIEVIDRWSVK